jgi:SAM-dependent methyltransferase
MHAPTAAIYDGAAQRWQASRGVANDDLGRRFREQAGGGLVVDLGCGPGRYLSQISAPVVAVDVSRSMLSLARRHGHPLAQADLESLPFAAGAFAGAFARHSYLHVPKGRAVSALADLRRVLAPGGFLMLSLIEGDYEGDRLADDEFPGRYFALWARPDLRDALTAAGFAEVTVERLERPRGEADLLATAYACGAT